MPKHTPKKNNVLPAVAAITAVSSCLMLGAVGAYRLTAGENRQKSQNITVESNGAEETEAAQREQLD